MDHGVSCRLDVVELKLSVAQCRRRFLEDCTTSNVKWDVHGYHGSFHSDKIRTVVPRLPSLDSGVGQCNCSPIFPQYFS